MGYTQDYRYKTELNTYNRVQKQNLKRGDRYAISYWKEKEEKEKRSKEMKVKAPRGYHFMKKKGKFKLMKNPKGGYKKHKGSSLTMNMPVVKRHSK